MPLLRRTLAITGYTSLALAGTFLAWTRHCHFTDIPPSDYLYHSTLYARYNPRNAPVTQDWCRRKVKIERIRPELLEGAEKGEGKLVEAFCAGVWGGLGYAYQRRYLERKYRSPRTAHQLWDRPALLTSSYAPGTQITDHFEVVAKTPTSIVVRCGDSPLVGVGVPRASDGLFEMVAEVRAEEGVVDFGLKSLFFDGTAEAQGEGEEVRGGPMTPRVQWAHMQYDKVLMESALRNCTR